MVEISTLGLGAREKHVVGQTRKRRASTLVNAPVAEAQRERNASARNNSAARAPRARESQTPDQHPALPQATHAARRSKAHPEGAGRLSTANQPASLFAEARPDPIRFSYPYSLWSRPEGIARSVQRHGPHRSNHGHVQRMQDDSTRQMALEVTVFTCVQEGYARTSGVSTHQKAACARG